MMHVPHPASAVSLEQLFTTIVDRTARVQGSFSSSEPCAIRIDGRFSGHICVANGLVALSESGVAEEVDIEADVVVIAGFLRGKVLAHTALHVCSSADISGSICTSATLRILSKATVSAHLEVRPAPEK